MPLTAGNFGIYTINLLSTAFNDAVKTDVVLERIGANNVIVVAIENADSNAAGLINVSGNRFESYGNIDVLGDDRLNDCERETIIRSVDLDCSMARPAKELIAHDSPFAKIALAGTRKLKVSWRRTDIHFCNANGRCGGL